jgi:uncharacterized protein
VPATGTRPPKPASQKGEHSPRDRSAPNPSRLLHQLAHPFEAPLTDGEQARLLAAVRELADGLVFRRSRRSKRYQRGRLDLRATMAASLRRDGVPWRRCYRKRTLRRSRLLLLVDLSGSVRHAARFVTALVASMQHALPATRVLAFVHHPAEATHLLQRAHLLDESTWHEALPELDFLGRSDFGNTFYRVLEDHEALLTRSTVLVIVGDARNNYADPMPWTLAELRRRVGYLLWLNPEPRQRWGRGDSAWPAYAPFVDQAARCSSTGELVELAQQLARLTLTWKSS